jgi:nucleotide-binding universal stress UspA family protein
MEARSQCSPGSSVESRSRGDLGLVMVGADGSDGSRRAVQWTAAFARVTGSAVLAVHVLTYDRELLRDFSLDTVRTWRRDLERELRSTWIEPLTAAGVGALSLVVERESVSEGLVEIASREEADLLVVGAKGRGGVAGRVLGGVTYRVTHRAHQPVVVVPPDWSPS